MESIVLLCKSCPDCRQDICCVSRQERCNSCNISCNVSHLNSIDDRINECGIVQDVFIDNLPMLTTRLEVLEAKLSAIIFRCEGLALLSPAPSLMRAL